MGLLDWFKKDDPAITHTIKLDDKTKNVITTVGLVVFLYFIIKTALK